MTRVLVLGGTGFIGGAIRRELAAALADGEVTCAGLGSTEPGVVDVDLVAAPDADLDALIGGVAPRCVVNCVGVAGGDPAAMDEVNHRFASRVARAVGRAAPGARLVHLGSSAEYGATTPGVPVSEAHPPAPLGDYGRTKLAGTLAVRDAAARGVDAVVLRPFNPVGPGSPDANLAGRAARSIAGAVAGRAAEVVLGPLDVHRDFVAVEDVAAAVAAACTAPGVAGDVLNVGSGVATSARDLVALLCRIAGWDGPVVERGDGSPRSPAVPWQAADIAAARARLGWEPRHGLDASLRALWAEVAGGAAA